jgi:hypothetical protein
MNQTVYLSIDIDFWRVPCEAKKCLESLFKTLPSDLPKIAVMNHQQLLNHINKNQVDLLINIDTHSDICDEFRLNELSCGSWVSYVKWRSKSKYLWVRSSYETTMGGCNSWKDWDEGLHLWQSVTSQHWSQKMDISELLEGKTLVGLGICLSPDFIHTNGLEIVFKDLVRKYKIPYIKGRRNENYDRKLSPIFVNKNNVKIGSKISDIYNTIENQWSSVEPYGDLKEKYKLVEKYQPQIDKVLNLTM